jgi:AraC family transcriptional regulator
MRELNKGNYSGKVLDLCQADGLIADVTYYPENDDTGFPHCHENAHLSFILKGQTFEKRKHGEFERFPGQLIFFDAGEEHQSITQVFPAKNINLELEPLFFRNNAVTEADINALAKSPRAKFTMLKVYQELVADDEYSISSINMLLLDLIHRRAKPASGHPAWMKSVFDVLNDRWNETPSLTELSAAADVHPVTISKYFPRYFSCSLGEYSRQLKIEKSLDLITTGSFSLTEIAHHCGFSDQSHFTRTFKRLTGLAPQRYRKL